MTAAVLYDYWRSSASYRVRIALNLKGVAYRTVPVDLLAGEQRSAAHLARHPQGLVPLLEIDGRRLPQSLPIMEYLEETRPAPAFLPADPVGRARVRALACAIAMEIHPVCNSSVVAHVEQLVGGGEATKIAWMQRYIGAGLAAFESLLAESELGPASGRFCHGDQPGLADCCLLPQLYNARRWGVELDGLTRIAAVEAACAEIDAFARAHPDAVKASAEA